jgi:DNA repair photolyase
MELVRFPDKPAIERSSLKYYDYTFAAYVGCQHRCAYCYSQNDAELDWDNQIGFIPDAPAKVEEALAGLKPQVIYVGGDTDPYQPVEADLEYTRQALIRMADRGFSGSILTKSDLFLRDLDILTRMAEPSVGVSIAFNDEITRQRFETEAPATHARLQALRAAKRAGIETYVLICPVFPGFTDTEALIDQVLPYADRVWIYRLDFETQEDRNWKRVEATMKRHHPDSLDEFRSIALSPQHSYWSDLRKRLEKRKHHQGLSLEIFV